MKKTLAIVSSYHELCGNATYTEVLKNEFQKYYDVTVFPLKTKWLESSNKNLKKLADEHICDIAKNLKNYDYVNIQFEAGLYGSYPNDVYRRIEILVKACNALIFTMHRVDIVQSIFERKTLKKCLSDGLFPALKYIRQVNYFAVIYGKIIRLLKEQAEHKNINIIVHTHKDMETVKYVYGFDRVVDFPITFLNREQRAHYSKNRSREAFCKKYGLDTSDTYIGLFGFIADYKAHDVAIHALRYLPDKYKILIFGSQHPMSIVPSEKVSPYIGIILEFIDDIEEKEKGFSKRVMFLGGLNDEDFITALHCCDFALLPYLETNQGGSGIASLVIESKIKALFSNNLSFTELKRYFPNCFECFDIGNYHEIAYKIEHYQADYRKNIEECLEKYNIENNILLHKKLFEGNVE